MEFLKYTKSRSRELAEYAQQVAKSPLSFDGEHPISHSSRNHVHLWFVEYLSDSFDWIDVDYRVEFVKYVLEQWRRRMRGLAPYEQRGYRLYVYEDRAPTISAVAETDIGFPYSYGQPIFVKNIRDVLAIYGTRSWKESFGNFDWNISQERILDTIRKNHGSIGKLTASTLGLQVGQLRKLIVNMGLDLEVNTIRKHFKRSPADFSNEGYHCDRWKVFERILKPGYN